MLVELFNNFTSDLMNDGEFGIVKIFHDKGIGTIAKKALAIFLELGSGDANTITSKIFGTEMFDDGLDAVVTAAASTSCVAIVTEFEIHVVVNDDEILAEVGSGTDFVW